MASYKWYNTVHPPYDTYCNSNYHFECCSGTGLIQVAAVETMVWVGSRKSLNLYKLVIHLGFAITFYVHPWTIGPQKSHKSRQSPQWLTRHTQRNVHKCAHQIILLLYNYSACVAIDHQMSKSCKSWPTAQWVTRHITLHTKDCT